MRRVRRSLATTLDNNASQWILRVQQPRQVRCFFQPQR